MRARELGITLGFFEPGELNAITDVPGVRVGHSTIVRGDDVRTGVTVVVPGELPAFAAPFRLNGNGEMTGLEWVRESGLLTTPVAITNTNAVGVVRDALVAAALEDRAESAFALPVVAETWDGRLNDINGFHVTGEHLREALAAASDGPVAEGNVGGGTGMISHGFKGGIGTSSRVVDSHTVGVLVQANHGGRRRFAVDGVPVGLVLGPERIPLPGPSEEPSRGGSIIVVVATDAPLLPHQCARVARRAPLGIGRTGGAGETSSGDLVLAFATGNRSLGEDGATGLAMLGDEALDRHFHAVIEATEEAIVNALLAAETMTARSITAHGLEQELLVGTLRAQGRL
jgi:D-aminopeptidase